MPTVGLREARRGDEPAVAELHVRSWQEAYRGIMPAEFLAGLDPGERAGKYEFEGGEGVPTTDLAVAAGNGLSGEGVGDDPSLTNSGEGVGDDPSLTNSVEGVGDDPSLTNSVEVRSGSSPTPFERIAGFATFGASRDADAAGLGEIYALYVDPQSYAKGLGRMLMADARRRLREAGIEEAILWVLRGNERAQHFYAREGWLPDGASRLEQPYGIVSDVIRLRRSLI